MTSPSRILVVDNDGNEREINRALVETGYDVTTVTDYLQADTRLVDSHYDLVIAATGSALERAEFIKRVRAVPALTGTLILAVADWGTGEAMMSLSSGADGYEPTPITSEGLITSVQRLLTNRATAAP